MIFERGARKGNINITISKQRTQKEFFPLEAGKIELQIGKKS